MKRSVTTIIIAVVIVVAGVIGLTLWRGTGSSVALADVLTQIQQVSVYMYQMTISTTGPTVGDEPAQGEVHATALLSQDLGMKITMDMGLEDPETSEHLVQETYVLPQQRRAVTLIPAQKKYLEMDLDDAGFEERQKQNNEPGTMVEQILACDYTSLGQSSIDGIDVEGFQTTDPNYMGGIMSPVDVKIWVDVNTRLPIRSEINVQMGEEMHMHMVMHDFQWDVPVNASEFEPVIPDGYTSMTDKPMKMPKMDEETALEGFKLLADLEGTYPEKLDLMTLVRQIGGLAVRDASTSEELDVEARTQEMIETMRPIQGLAMFHMLLVQEGKEPIYYGNVVTPADGDQVLLRWKVSETEYRVIFGDLHAEAVTAEALAKLEAKLPK